MTDPVEALGRIAHLLERAREPTYRVRAFRRAAATIKALERSDLEHRAATGRLRDLPGIGEKTERVIREALAGEVPAYLRELEAAAGAPEAAPQLSEAGAALLASLRGDCHMHSDWSDGGSPIDEMVRTARDLGHEWVALTDHSPRLTVAKGLSRERLLRQLEVVAALNTEMAPFRILTGIEVDINLDGSLDQDDELLDRLDVVVASVHSKLRMERAAMTERMLLAVANPRVDILGHCTGRLVDRRVGGDGPPKGRPESEFDADLIFAACLRFGTAVEVNSRPERLDPPKRLLRRAVQMGCLLAVDTDAHAPGQLEWQHHGAERAAACGATAEMVVNSWPAERVLEWAASHPTP